MGFVERELKRIEAEIVTEPQDTDRFRQLFAAQQALGWSLEPSFYQSPLDSINKVPGTSVSREPTLDTATG